MTFERCPTLPAANVVERPSALAGRRQTKYEIGGERGGKSVRLENAMRGVSIDAAVRISALRVDADVDVLGARIPA